MNTTSTTPKPVAQKLEALLATDGLLTGADAHFLHCVWVDNIEILEQTPLWAAKCQRAELGSLLDAAPESTRLQLHINLAAAEEAVKTERRRDSFAVHLERLNAKLLSRITSHVEAATDAGVSAPLR